MSTAAAASRRRVDPELIRRFDRHGPRYTSYPTALEFHEGVAEGDYLERLTRADAEAPDQALSLYVHIPFCERLCTFCACHVIPTPRREVARRYLRDLDRELALLTEHLPRRRRLAQMQWGGGTPTYLSPEELTELFTAVRERFVFEPEAEISIEVDPRVTTRAHLEVLAALGFNRLSLGVQDFTPSVQAAIGRDQGFAETRMLVEAARALGFGEGINFDLIYGLPGQDEAGFEANLARVLELRPDRVALYSFAYVPWARPHQRQIAAESLPPPGQKLALYQLALERLLDGGYEAIGMDHFALPGDELARAARESRLDRNFMGYAVRVAPAMVALGVSGIGELDGAYFQNERKLSRYSAALEAGRLPIQRGYLLDGDDRLRQHVIRQLLCHFAIDKREIERRFGIEFDSYFAGALAQLEAPCGASETGLIANDERRLEVTEAGRLFVRNLCMVFDRYLEPRRDAGQPAFSRTV